MDGLDASCRGCRAWFGNCRADENAGQAADEHALPTPELARHPRARAVAALIRKRIAIATVDAF